MAGEIRIHRLLVSDGLDRLRGDSQNDGDVLMNELLSLVEDEVGETAWNYQVARFRGQSLARTPSRFHDGKKPADVILVANGINLTSSQYPITHVSATKGRESSWKCVGSSITLTEVVIYHGFTDGYKTGIDLNSITENRNLLVKTSNALPEINELCKGIKDLCVRRDHVLKELEEIKIDVGEFKRLTAYYEEM